MLRQWFSSLLTFALILLILAVLVSAASAKPKFKILQRISGGLFSGLTVDAKGHLYGATSAGGDHGGGSVFELTRNAKGQWNLTTLHSFNGPDGASPNGGLIFDPAGNLYGTTHGGGAFARGTAFELTPGSAGWAFTDVYDFCPEYPYNCDDGETPNAGLVMDSAGILYGSAGGGRCHGFGVAFEFLPGSGGWQEKILFNWGCRDYDATASNAPLTLDQAGNLYGTSFYGGLNHEGTVFELKRGASNWKERLLRSFDGSDGLGPYAGVIFDLFGNLYGTTNQGGSSRCGETTCGTVFKLTPTHNGHWKETVLYDFPNPTDGNFPGGGVVFDKEGNLYGATVAGGIGGCSGGCGVIYKLSPVVKGRWKCTVLHKFNGNDGGQPMGALILDQKGDLYGTAYNVVYEITP